MGSKLENWSSHNYPFTLPMRHKLWGPADKGILLCLHGYQDHALSMLRRIGWWEQELPFQVLAINAPFPVPIWTAEGFQEAYAWYFRDTERGFTIVSPEETAKRVFQLICDLGYEHAPMAIFGFSQGGYLAPFIARHLKRLRGLICLGSGYPLAPYQHLQPTSVYALLGEKDERIPLKASREAHALLLKQGFRGEFLSVAGLSHRVDPVVEPKIRALAVELLA